MSEAVDLNSFKKGKLNLIQAPPGSGKTTFAVRKLPELASEKVRVLFLIDMAVGKDQLLKNSDVQLISEDLEYYKEIGCVPKQLNKIIVMTYAYFGTLVKFNSNFPDDFELIICDELHNIFWPINLSRGNIVKNSRIITEEDTKEILLKCCSNYIALEKIKECVVNQRQFVVGITATPKKVLKQLGSLVEEVIIENTLVQYQTNKTVYYRNIEQVLNRIASTQKAIIYIPHVKQIKKYVSMLRENGIRAEGIWSLSNHKSPMNKRQTEIRSYIIQNNNLPDDVDVLFINKSNETSLNIFTKLDYMVIHSSDEDVQIQARGRFRGDLKMLYLFDKLSNFELPLEMLNVRLYKKDVDEFIFKNNIRNSKGELIGQPTFKKLLIENGYEIKENRDRKSTYFIAS